MKEIDYLNDDWIKSIIKTDINQAQWVSTKTKFDMNGILNTEQTTICKEHHNIISKTTKAYIQMNWKIVFDSINKVECVYNNHNYQTNAKVNTDILAFYEITFLNDDYLPKYKINFPKIDYEKNKKFDFSEAEENKKTSPFTKYEYQFW